MITSPINIQAKIHPYVLRYTCKDNTSTNVLKRVLGSMPASYAPVLCIEHNFAFAPLHLCIFTRLLGHVSFSLGSSCFEVLTRMLGHMCTGACGKNGR